MLDEELAKQAQQNAQAFGVLYDRYIGRIYAYVYRQTRDEATAKDVTSATFEKALRFLRKQPWQGASFCGWLYKIAHNELMQHYRRERFLAPLREWWGGRGRMAETAVLHHQLHAELHQALTRLSERDQQVLTFRYFEELSHTEMAEALGCSVDNVYLRLHRALQRLRQQMERMGMGEQWAIDRE